MSTSLLPTIEKLSCNYNQNKAVYYSVLYGYVLFKSIPKGVLKLNSTGMR